jgi:lactoylglutathione lyase
MKLVHAAIKTVNLDKSLAFYTDILNMHIKEKKYIEAHKVTLVFLQDNESNFEIELIFKAEAENKKTENVNYGNKNSADCSFAHFAFMTDNIDGDFIAMKEKGAVFMREPSYSRDKSMKFAFIKDPDDNMIELIQYFKL